MMDPAERPGLVQDPELQMAERVLKVEAAPEPPHTVTQNLLHVVHSVFTSSVSVDRNHCSSLQVLVLSASTVYQLTVVVQLSGQNISEWTRVIILEWQLRSDPVCVLVSGLFH